MKKILLLLIGVVMTATLFTGCQDDQAAGPQVSKAVLDRIWDMGFSNENVQKVEEGYLVEGDIILTDADLQSSIDPITLRIAETEQYRTTNLVTGGTQTITVSMDSQLNGIAGYSQALDECIARYNGENLSLTFVRSGTSGGDIHFKKQPGNYLASSGFPTNQGDPWNLVKMNSNAIGNGNSNTFINYCATIMAHEMGHCIGFRHTDYMNRAYSCGGSPVNEGDGGVGAILIPGTPSGPDANSWMLACIGSGVNRPFNNNDKTALNYLY
jgi:hypothetical protein